KLTVNPVEAQVEWNVGVAADADNANSFTLTYGDTISKAPEAKLPEIDGKDFSKDELALTADYTKDTQTCTEADYLNPAAGLYIVTLKDTGNVNFKLPADYVIRVLVNPKEIEVNWNVTPNASDGKYYVEYGSALPAATFATLVGTDSVDYSVEYTRGGDTLTDPDPEDLSYGDYTVVLTLAAEVTNYVLSDEAVATITVSISKVVVNVSIGNAATEYGLANGAAAITAFLGEHVTVTVGRDGVTAEDLGIELYIDLSNISGAYLPVSTAGYAILGRATKDTNYTAVFTQGKLTVTAKTVAINWKNVPDANGEYHIPYGQMLIEPEVMASSLVAGESCGLTFAYTRNNAVVDHTKLPSSGTYLLMVTALDNGNYRLPAERNITVVVDAREIAVTIGNYSAVYGEATVSQLETAIANLFTVPDAAFIDGNVHASDLFTLKLAVTGKLGAGKYAIYGERKSGDVAESYHITFVGEWDEAGEYNGEAGVLTITPRTLTVSGVVVEATREYNGLNTAKIENAGTLTGVLAGDRVTHTVTGKFETPSAGENKTVFLTYGALEGDDAANYVLDAVHSQATATATITAIKVEPPAVEPDPENPDGNIEYQPGMSLSDLIPGFDPNIMEMEIYNKDTGETIKISTDDDGNKIVEITKDGSDTSTTIKAEPDGTIIYVDTTVTDENGNLVTTRTDKDGNVTTIVTIVDENGNTTTIITAPDGTVTTIVTETDKDGKETTTETKTDDSGTTTTTTVKDTDGKVTETVTNPDGSGKTTVVDTEGNTTVIEKDTNGNTTVTATDKNGNTTKTENFEDGSSKTTITDGNKTTVIEKDAEGNTTTTVTVKNEDGGSTVTKTDKDGNVTTTTTDKDGNVVSKVEITKDEDGNTVTTVTDGNGNVSTMVTDENGNVLKTETTTKDETGKTTTVEKDNETGKTTTTTTDANGNTTTTELNPDGSKTTTTVVTDGNGTTTTTTTETDKDGNTTTTTTVTDKDGNTVSTTTDKDGNTDTSVTSGTGFEITTDENNKVVIKYNGTTVNPPADGEWKNLDLITVDGTVVVGSVLVTTDGDTTKTEILDTEGNTIASVVVEIKKDNGGNTTGTSTTISDPNGNSTTTEKDEEGNTTSTSTTDSEGNTTTTEKGEDGTTT
ncbi:MAG: hypothetical protein NC489_43780, partial [Ruminococcus flavefaciens]|nr:hypothetical protein [Ruminococcus flavefaciens]